jgi:hypothetical protein
VHCRAGSIDPASGLLCRLTTKTTYAARGALRTARSENRLVGQETKRVSATPPLASNVVWGPMSTCKFLGPGPPLGPNFSLGRLLYGAVEIGQRMARLAEAASRDVIIKI